MIKMLNAFDYGDCKTRPYACDLCNCSNGTSTPINVGSESLVSDDASAARPPGMVCRSRYIPRDYASLVRDGDTPSPQFLKDLECTFYELPGRSERLVKVRSPYRGSFQGCIAAIAATAISVAITLYAMAAPFGFCTGSRGPSGDARS